VLPLRRTVGLAVFCIGLALREAVPLRSRTRARRSMRAARGMPSRGRRRRGTIQRCIGRRNLPGARCLVTRWRAYRHFCGTEFVHADCPEGRAFASTFPSPPAQRWVPVQAPALAGASLLWMHRSAYYRSDFPRPVTRAGWRPSGPVRESVALRSIAALLRCASWFHRMLDLNLTVVTHPASGTGPGGDAQ
jgi:hypothetical protein